MTVRATVLDNLACCSSMDLIKTSYGPYKVFIRTLEGSGRYIAPKGLTRALINEDLRKKHIFQDFLFFREIAFSTPLSDPA